MFKINLYILLFFIFSKFVIAKPIDFDGLSKLNLNDLQSITLYSLKMIWILKKIILSELTLILYEVSYKESSIFILRDLIENIISTIMLDKR